jgi:hypothetical protein
MTDEPERPEGPVDPDTVEVTPAHSPFAEPAMEDIAEKAADPSDQAR